MGRAPRQRQLVADGLRTPVLESGPPESDEAVVFVPGNPGTAEDWREMVIRTGGFARAVALTMPGFGGAEKPRDFDYSIVGYARHLQSQLDALGIRRAHLVLHDFAGPWGLQWAADHPEAFLSVVLVDTGIFPGYRWHALARLWRRRGIGELAMAATTRWAFGRAARRGQPRRLPRAFVERMWRDFDKGTRRAILRLYRGTDVGEWSSQVAGRLRPLDRPALVVWGGHNPFIPAGMAEHQLEAFPRARLLTLPESGHWPFADDPERFAAEVEPFLREQVTAA